MKNMTTTTMMMIATVATGSMAAVAEAELLAYWAQNDNELSSGGSGFEEGSFPQMADAGVFANAAALTVGGGDLLSTNENGVYEWIESFAGTSVNALDGFDAGESITFQGGTEMGNNGSWIQLNLTSSGYQDLVLSFAARGTGTGFSANQVSYSFDGLDFTDFGDSFDPRDGSNWNIFTFDFGGLLDDQEDLFIRITLDGATGPTGNNRFDNLQISGALIPAPGAIALLGIAGLVGTRRRRA